MVPDGTLDRFRSDLDALVPRGERIGIAVSGGPDSLALLLLAAQARPGEVAAATVDHGFRADSRDEAEAVAKVCQTLGVRHAILAVEWDATPTSAIQERARSARYETLAGWMRDRSLTTLLTGHHLDDQAETLIMRLSRGSGVTGLAGMRSKATVPGSPALKLLRPLLGWRHAELEAICAEAGVTPANDPSNGDTRHERVRIRQALASADWVDAGAIARSASNLAAADLALEWAVDREWSDRVSRSDGTIVYSSSEAPAEIRRRIASRAIAELASEGPRHFRSAELNRLVRTLEDGQTATLRGVRCKGGTRWEFRPAPLRRVAL